ncbi:MAG: DUF6498-containing protein [Halieaceae bacterium]|jgi:hypothetical protein|nr:DUF6498-containing protein [Halieaceae bacterium]
MGKEQTADGAGTVTRYLSLASLVVVNLLPVFGVFLFDWDVGALMVLYWSENLVIGFYTILRMLVVSPIGGVFSSLFFLVHYGGFCAVHGLFVATMMLDMESNILGASNNWPFALIFVELLVDVIAAVLSVAPPEWLWGFLALVLSHGISFLQNFLLGGERSRVSLGKLMGAPYARMMVLHVAIIFGGFAVMALGQRLWMLLMLVALKLALDIVLHRREHRRMQELPVSID